MAASFPRKCTISGDVTQHDAKMNVKQETAALQTKTSLTRHVDTTIRRFNASTRHHTCTSTDYVNRLTEQV